MVNKIKMYIICMRSVITCFLLMLIRVPKITGSRFIRGNMDKTPSRVILSNDGSFNCNLYALDGMSVPGTTPVQPEWICVIAPSEIQDNTITLFFDNDVQKNLGKQISDVSLTTLTIPWAAVSERIISSHYPGIKVNHDINRRQRYLAKKSGTHNVLIIRVVGNDAAPYHWKVDLIDGFFNENKNNLSTRYRACSKGNLNIVPATGPANVVTNGVMNIELNTSIGALDYMAVSDLVMKKLYHIQGLSYTTKILVIPNAVDFKGGAAWAAFNGDTIWIQDSYAKFPIVQVHEYGHLLGQHHSGKGDQSYADDTGYMGNMLPWDEHGAITCFNPAKTWYLNWFSWRHIEIDPRVTAFNNILVSLDDVVNNNAESDKMIVKVTGDKNEFFVMFNRAKGVNKEAVGYRDKVVVTQQNQENAISYAMAGLGEGEYWSFDNFGGTDKTLVIQNCNSSASDFVKDTAKVLIYLKGFNDQSCSPLSTAREIGSNFPSVSPTASPKYSDTCNNDNSWYDDGGEKFNCGWYELNPNRCHWYGDGHRNFNKVANEACCVCGGGQSTITRDSKQITNSHASIPSVCVTDDNWHDIDGFDCKWYETTQGACKLFGHRYKNMKKVANEACCVCQNQ